MHKLSLQRAGQSSDYLLEHLLLESIGARRGGGMFAWTNYKGSRSLLEDEVFDEFLRDGEFRLVVGTDTITDPPAVHNLKRIAARRPGLEALAFLSPTTSLFHPKVAWFEHDGYLSLIIGSGNLTMGGLKANWEAFTVTHLYGDEAEFVLEEIDNFVAEASSNIVPIEDPRVLERVALNVGNERSLRGRSPESPVTSLIDEVLIAEIPKSGARWKQANFDQYSYVNFFGAAVGSQRRIILYQVDEAGNLGEMENRPSVEVASQNYRFELEAASGVPYPSSGKPIGVFLRLRSGDFVYRLLLPGDEGHAEMDQTLSSWWTGPIRNMRRVCVPVDTLMANWPGSPFEGLAVPTL